MHEAAAQDLAAPSPRLRVGAPAFAVMMSSLAAQAILFGLTPALLPAMARSYGGGAHAAFIAQMVSALASLGLMITSLVSGRAARLLGVRRLLIASAAVYGLAGIVPALTAQVTVMLGSRILTGGACGLLTTACAMLLSHYFTGTARSRALGYQSAIGSMAGLLVLIAGGALVTRLGWQMPFLVHGLFAVPLVVLALTRVREVPIAEPVHGQGLSQAFTRIWPVCIAAALLMMLPLLVGSNVPFVLTGIGVTDPVRQSLIIALVNIMSAASGAAFGAVQQGVGVRRTFSLALLIAALGMALLGLGATWWMITAGCALSGLAVGLYIPHLYALSTTLVPESLRGHAIGLATTSMFLGGFLYPFLVGGLQSLFGLQGAMQSIAVLLALAASAALIARGARLAGAPYTKPA